MGINDAIAASNQLAQEYRMTTTPLNWREHMTEEEETAMFSIDNFIGYHRRLAEQYTSQRETIRRRITSRVRWERIKATRENT